MCSSRRCQGLSNRPELADVKEQGSAECSDVISHVELTVNQNAQSFTVAEHFTSAFVRVRVVAVTSKLLPCTRRYDLRLIFIQLQAISLLAMQSQINRVNSSITLVMCADRLACRRHS